MSETQADYTTTPEILELKKIQEETAREKAASMEFLTFLRNARAEFTNRLYDQWHGLDSEVRVWIENFLIAYDQASQELQGQTLQEQQNARKTAVCQQLQDSIGRMREAQKEYFKISKTGSQSQKAYALEKSKYLEKQVDSMISQLNDNQTKIF
jgi:hypothetical protein